MHVHDEAAAGRLGERDGRLRHDARARHERCSYSGRPSPRAARGSLQMRTASSISRARRRRARSDVEDRVVGELHRRVVPHARSSGPRPGGCPGGSVSPTGRTPHERSRVPHQRSGVTAMRSPPTSSAAAPAARLREAQRVEQHAAVLADVLARLLERRDRALPGQVAGEPVLVRLEHEAQLPERLRAPRRGTARRSCPCGRRARATRAPRGGAAAPHARERVLHAEVRVLAQPHHHEQLVARAVQVEVVAVVEVAIAGADVADRLGDLVDRDSRPRTRA